MDYFSSWNFYFYVLWISSAIGYGVCLGVLIFSIVDKLVEFLVERLSNLKFKKDK